VRRLLSASRPYSVHLLVPASSPCFCAGCCQASLPKSSFLLFNKKKEFRYLSLTLWPQGVKTIIFTASPVIAGFGLCSPFFSFGAGAYGFPRSMVIISRPAPIAVCCVAGLICVASGLSADAAAGDDSRLRYLFAKSLPILAGPSLGGGCILFANNFTNPALESITRPVPLRRLRLTSAPFEPLPSPLFFRGTLSCSR